MIEQAPRSPESMLPGESMATEMDYWLSEEIKSSISGSNAYLDNMETFSDTARAKTASHYDRMELWTEQFAKDPSDMKAITLLLYSVQTGLSGAFREHCYLLAKNPEDYARRRTARPLSIDIAGEVGNRLTERFGRTPNQDDLALPSVSADELAAQTKEVNKFRLTALNKLHDDPRRSQHLLFYHVRLLRLQTQWLHLGVDYMVHAAYINGGKLDDLEFMEPIPITRAQPYKPFER